MQKYLFRIKVTAILILICAGVVRADDPGAFDFRAGIGYDFVSQEYFLDSLRYTGADPSLSSALLKKDYLDDKKGFLYLKFQSNPEIKAGREYILETGWEQTPETYRALGWGRYGSKMGSNRLEAGLRLETKERFEGTIESGEELTVINGDLAFKRQWSDMVESKLKLYAENVSFDSSDSYIYDYSRYGIELGFGYLSKNFNSLYFNSAYEIRNVPDSGQLDYQLIRSGLGFFGVVLGIRLSADLNAEARFYNQENDQDNYFLLSHYAEARILLGSDYSLKCRNSLEYFDYGGYDFINDDYYLARSRLLFVRERGLFAVGIGPEIELMSISSDFAGDDDYLEYMGSVNVDYFGLDGIFLLFENQLGKRNYKNNPAYTSGFTFDRVNLVGSARIYDRLNFDILLSVEWEWHEINSDNSRLYLTSVSLSYQF